MEAGEVETTFFHPPQNSVTDIIVQDCAHEVISSAMEGLTAFPLQPPYRDGVATLVTMPPEIQARSCLTCHKPDLRTGLVDDAPFRANGAKLSTAE
jgi:hypothetical protein